MDKGTWILGGLTILVFGGLIGWAAFKEQQVASKPPLEQCVEHAGLGMHIHPQLQITQDGQPVMIPANIGIEPTCMRPIHTHDVSGMIHLEFPVQHDFTLGEFFKVWGQPLHKDGYNLTMTVDGQANNDGEKLVLKDHQQIVLTYTKK